jgi:hypothetical protein
MDKKAPASFTVGGAERIVRAVRRLEAMPQVAKGQQRRQYQLRAGADVTVVVTGDGGYGGGKYAGLILLPRTGGADVPTAGTLSESEIGSTADAPSCIVLNAQEIGSSTHWLTDAGNSFQKYFNGRITYRNSDGTLIVTINGVWANPCS